MNRIYRSIWNQATGAYAAVSENVRSAGKRSLPGSTGGGAHFALTSMAAALMLGYGSLALAGPTGGTVVAGQASINGAPGNTVIQQGSQNAVINWANFNIGQGESVRFNQPNSNAVALNRVLGNDGTTILGNLSANGKVFIVNPNGVLFGQGASVNTAGLVASTLDISTSDFMAGKYQFSGNGTGKVLNQGSISAPGGYVALLGANVSNEGTIQARLGSVALAAGRAITLDVAGDGLLNVAINAGAVGALVNNGGLIQADGGSVVLSAQAAGDLLKTVVNNTGVIEAHSIDTRGGTIKLLGDMQTGTVHAGGTLDASAPTGGNGGFIDTSAAHVKIDDALKVTTAAAKGLAGTWLIDPTDFNIAARGGDMTGAFLSNTLKSGNVQIQSISGSGGTQGNINVNDTISWAANKLTLTAQNNININTAMRGAGTASLALEYGQSSAAGTGSSYNVKAEVDLPSGSNFSTKQGSGGTVISYKVINSLGGAGSMTGNDLQGINGGLTGNYVLGSNIDATATSGWNGSAGFMPIGSDASRFTGKFDGLGHVVNNLKINRSEIDVGLFGTIGSTGSVGNLGLVGANIAGAAGSYLGTAALAGTNFGQVSNSYSTGNISASDIMTVGGLVGRNFGGISNSRSSASVVSAGFYGGGGLVGNNAAGATVTNSFASGTVTGDGTGSVGGLVGFNYGLISRSFASGAVSGGQRAGGLTAYNRYQGVGENQGIEYSYATGTVTGHANVGGLVGENDNAKISNSYSTSVVTGTAGSGLFGNTVGGLVGFNQSGGTIINSYATGNVSGAANVGGVVGWNNNTSGTGGVRSTLTNVYSTGAVSGTSNVGAIAGQNGAPNGIVNGFYNSTVNTAPAIGANTNGGTGTTTGLSSTQMKTASNFTGFNFTTSGGSTGNKWVMVNADGTFNSATGTGATLPMLSSEWSTSITSAHQLQLMGLDLTAQYVLANDISAARTASSTLDVWNSGTFIPVGTGSSANTATHFNGSLDGAFHVITGLTINRPGQAYNGLFGTLGASGVVKSLGLEGGSVAAGADTGVLAGDSFGTISNVYSTVAVSGGQRTGGLIGAIFGGSVSDSYASGSVTGSAVIAGGLAGRNDGAIINSYASGTVSAVATTGGLAGSGAGTVSNSFWDKTTTGQNSSAGGLGIGLTTAQMKTLANFNSATAANGLANPNWELGITWVVYDGNTMPLLRGFMKQLAVSFDNATKTYDGLAYNGAVTGVYSNLTDNNLQGTLVVGGGAAGAVNAGNYVINGSGLYTNGGQHGYSITYIDGSLTVNKLAIALNGAAAGNKTYDGTTAAIVSGNLSGVLAGDIGNVTFSGTGAYSDKNAGTGKTVTANATLGGSAGGNYALAPINGLTGNITPKALTVTGVTATNKVYDGTVAASVAGGTLSGFVSGETVGLSSLSATFADKNAGNDKAVTVTGGSLSDGTNGLASNYTFGSVTGLSADITQKGLTVTGVTVASKAYDGNTNASISGGTLNGLVSGETLTLSGQSGTFDDQNAGNGKAVTVTGATLGNGSGLASNYTVTNAADASGNITRKALTVNGVTAADKVYDGSVAATVNGGTLSGLVGSETLGLSSLTGLFGDKNAGASKAVTVTGGALSDGTGGGLASNYTVGPVTGLLASITPKALTLSGVTVSAKAYDGTKAATLTGGTLDGLVAGETLSVSGQSGEYNDKNAGTGKVVTVTGTTLVDGSGLASNYSVSNPNGVTGDITKKALTISGITASNRVYTGTTAVSLGGTVILDGLVGAEGVGVGGMVGMFADKNVGTNKPVTITGAVMTVGSNGGLASNYTISNPTGVTANITKATISAVTNIVIDSKVYDGGLNGIVNAAGATFGGIKSGDSLTVNATTATFADKNVGTGKTVTISGIGLGGTDAGNYNLTTTTGSSTGAITPKALTITGMSAVNKVYDGNTKASVTGGSISGLVGSETLGVTGLTVTFDTKDAGNGKTVTATGTTLVNGGNGGLASNYSMANPTGFMANITPKALTVSGMTAGTRAYDGTTTATLTGGALSGLVTGETLVVSGGTGVFVDKNAGNGKAVTVSGVGIADGTGLASNYSVTSPTNVTGSITQKALSVTGALAADKTYDGALDATITGGSLSGFVGSETVGLASLAGAFANQNAGSDKAVSVTGGTLSNGSNGGLASNYSVGPASGLSASITQKALTVTGVAAANKVYDATTKATVTGGTLNGLVGGETLSLSGLSGAFGDKNAGTAKAVIISGATLADGTGLASNYTVSNPSGVTANINKATISSVTNVVADSKIYDGGTSVTFTSATATFNGMVSGDSLAIGATNAAFSDKNAGSGKTVTISHLDLAGTDAANYNLATTTASGTGTITPKALTITGMSAVNKVYDGNTKATLSGGSISGLVGSETLGVTGLSAAFDDKNAGTGKTVTATGSTLVNGGNGGLAANYTISNPTGLLANITPKALTVTGMTAGNKVYDGNTSATLAGGSLSGLVTGETLVVSGGTGVFADKNAGNGKAVTVSGVSLLDGTGLASNYSVTNPANVSASITPKALTVTDVTADNKTYDGNVTATLSGGTLNGLVNDEILVLSGQSGVFGDKNAGNGKTVTVSGATLGNAGSGSTAGLASNYTVSNATGVTADIVQKQLTVGGITAGNKVYDGSTAAVLDTGSATFVGLVTGDSLQASASGAFSDKNAASDKTVNISGIVLGGVDAGNYTLDSTSATTRADITAKALTVTGQLADNKVYDGNTQASLSGGALSGLVAGESLGLSGQSAVFSDKNAATAKAVTVTGTTLVDTSTGLASNYTVSDPSGLTASITPKALAVTGQLAGNKVYDGNTAAGLSGGALSGLVAGETLGFGGQTAAFSDKNAGNGKAVTVSGTTLLDGSGAASNYTVVDPTGLTASITPKALTVAGQVAGNKVYDGNAVAQLTGGSLVGLVGDEALAIGGQTAAFSDKNAGNGKAVTVSGTTLLDGSGAASNYTVSNPTGLTASITPKALTVAGQIAGNKVYDGNAVAQLIGGSLVGLVGGETLAIGGQTAAFSDKNAGNAKTVTVSGTTLLDGSGSASNYTVSNPTGLTASITPKALTVAGQVAGNKVYDGNAVAQLTGGSLVGLVGDEALAIGGQTAAFSDKNVGNAKAVTVTGTTLLDTATGLAGNYTVGNPTGLMASITPKALTVAGQVAGNKVYDGNAVAQLSGGSLVGLVGGETLAIGGQTAAFGDKNAGNAKAVTVSGTTLLDTATGLAGNYTLSNPTGLTASITPKALTVGATAANKVYDTTTGATVNLRDDRIAGDQLSIASNGATFADKNAGQGKTVTVGGIRLAGADAGNYAVNATALTTANITQAQLTVKADNAEKSQGQPNPLFSASYTGLLGGDTVASELSGNLLLSTSATTGSSSGNYLITASGQSSVNYALDYVDGVLKVNPTEALQSAVAAAVASVVVAPSQGNMVQADQVSTGETVALAAPVGEKGGATVLAPVAVPLNGNTVTNVLPGLRLSVINQGVLLPPELGGNADLAK